MADLLKAFHHDASFHVRIDGGAAAVGTEPVYATRSATGRYRTSPLRGIWQHPPYFHDGSAATLSAVVDRWDQHFTLNLSASQKADLVEFLKSL